MKIEQVWDAAGAYNLPATFSLLSMGSGDPCLQIDAPDRLRLALQSPHGPATIEVIQEASRLRVTLVGAASEWFSQHMEALLGIGFRPPTIRTPRRLRDVAHRFAGMRVPQLPSVSLRLVQILLQQLISFRDACAGWRNLVHRHGTPVQSSSGLWFPPPPRILAKMVSYQFVECGILPQLGQRVVAAMRSSSRIETIWDAGRDAGAADRTCDSLRRIPGIGPWTIGFLRGAGLGDADAVVLGDYGHPRHVAHFFTGRETADDQEMLRLLEPYRPHRFYTLALLLQGVPRLPRRGPRRNRLRDRFRP